MKVIFLVVCLLLPVPYHMIARTSNNIMAKRTRHQIHLKISNWNKGIRSVFPNVYSAYFTDSTVIILCGIEAKAQIILTDAFGTCIYDKFINLEKDIPLSIYINNVHGAAYTIKIIDNQNGVYTGNFNL